MITLRQVFACADRHFIWLRGSLLMGVILFFGVWFAIFAKYNNNIQSDWSSAVKSNRNLATLFEEHVQRSIGELDKALLYIRRTIETRLDRETYETMIKTTDILSEIIIQVAIIDENGILRASNASAEPTKPLDLSDREHFKVHRGNYRHEP